jgi:hypothetical protein
MSSARFAVALFFAWAILGCSEKPSPTSKDLAQDLQAYLQQLQAWETLENEVFQALLDVERTYYVDDDFVIRRFKAALPKIVQHIGELSAVRPGTAEVRAIHEQYLEGWRDFEAGFQAVVAAMEAKDYIRLASAKNAVEGGRRKILAAAGRLEELVSDVGPELKELR